jgi:predicted N-formylglutamate amidohydrolase
VHPTTPGPGPPASLLDPGDPDPVIIERPRAQSAFFLTCEHAGRRLPRCLGTLGLAARHLERHIAWDVGAGDVASRLAQHLDATLVKQSYSRLVADCNRAPHAHDFIPVRSEDTDIPGNRGLTAHEVAARTDAVFRPYHECITAALDARARAARPTLLVSVHSFTPVFLGIVRPWHVGVLYEHDARYAGVLLALLAGQRDLRVGDNEPYRLTSERDYAVPVHGQGRGLPHVEIEIRQDLIATEAGQREWAERLAEVLERGRLRLQKREAP